LEKNRGVKGGWPNLLKIAQNFKLSRRGGHFGELFFGGVSKRRGFFVKIGGPSRGKSPLKGGGTPERRFRGSPPVGGGRGHTGFTGGAHIKCGAARRRGVYSHKEV